jgi:hypothetical protein
MTLLSGLPFPQQNQQNHPNVEKYDNDSNYFLVKNILK